jgi:hypothetical protein
MANIAVTADPGDLTVPLLSGWGHLATALGLLVALLLVVSVLAAARSGRGDRAEWQEWLAARPRPSVDPSGEPEEGGR